MAEEFQAGICGGNWWNMNHPSRSVFPLGSSSLCSIAANNDGGNYSCSWQTDNLVDLKTPIRSCDEGLVSDHHDSLGFLGEQKPKQQNESSSSASENGNFLMDSTLQIMGFGLPSSTTSSNWNNQSLFGRPESNFHSVLEEEAGVESSNSEMIQKDWSQKRQVSSIKDAFKPMNQEFSVDQQNLSSASYGYGLYDEHNNPLHPHPHPHPNPQPQPEDSLFTNPSMAYSYNSSNEVSPSWSKASHFLKPSMPKQQLSGFHFSNNTNNNSTPFWNNASAEALDDVPAHVFASSPQSQAFEHKPNCSTLITKHKREEAPVSEPAFKRPRIETPSPLPTFKVRKEKLGDRITALQQLVSPFGKTDTASVLHEAIEYIKYLHDQVSVFSAPYLNSRPPRQPQQGFDEKESKGTQDLRSQGLCLAPISSTFTLANYEITTELWTHTYGGALMR